MFWRGKEMKQGDLCFVNELHQELEREDMLKVIKHELKQQSHIMAIFYSDNYSHDLNLHLNIVVQPIFYQEMIEHKRLLASKFGKVLFFEENRQQRNTIIVHYENLLKVFITFHHPKLLKPSIDYKKITIVKDSYGLMAYINEQSDKIKDAFNFEDLDNWRTKFFSNYYEFYRSLQCQESYQVGHCLDVMRWLVATMWMVQNGNKPNSYLDWAHMEGHDSLLSSAQQEKLKQWEHRASDKKLEEIVNLIVEEFNSLHEELCAKLQLVEEQDYVYRVLARAKQFGSIQQAI